MIKKHSNIKLIHIVDGVDIKYNDWEENKETLFAFDSNNTFMQKFTYPCDIHSDRIDSLIECLNTVDVDENCFLYYSYQYQISFAHYVSQCLPKIKYVIDDHSLKIVIPRSTYTSMCREMLDIFDIREDRIIMLEDNILYNFKNLHTMDNIYHSPGGFVHPDVVYVCSKIRSKLNINKSTPYRKVYLKKDGFVNVEFNNTEVGISRKIVNESEIISYLESNGFEIIHLGDKTMSEKAEILKDIKVLITQLGANCMNFVFANGIEKCLLLSNDRPVGSDYYVNVSYMLTGSIINFNMIQYPSIDLNADPKNSTNSPFYVNMDDVVNYVRSL